MSRGDVSPRPSAVDRIREAGLALFDVVPGVRRTLTELKRIEVIDRSMVIAAQALFSVTPLLVVPSGQGGASLAQLVPRRSYTAIGGHARAASLSGREVADAGDAIDHIHEPGRERRQSEPQAVRAPEVRQHPDRCQFGHQVPRRGVRDGDV